MVTLGRIPDRVTAPFVRIAPAIQGTFRWSGTTILIFTPDPKRPLPFATTYQVTVDTSATAVSGRKLARAGDLHASRRRPCACCRPTGTGAAARSNGADGGAAAVQPAGAAAGRRRAPDGGARSGTSGSRRRLHATRSRRGSRRWIPAALGAFDAQGRRDARRWRPAARRWPAPDQRLGPAALPRVAAISSVFETTSPVAPGELGQARRSTSGCRRRPGRPRRGKPQTYTIRVERAFFVDDFYCTAECDGDALEPARACARRSRSPTSPPRFAPPTSPRGEQPVAQGGHAAARDATTSPTPAPA